MSGWHSIMQTLSACIVGKKSLKVVFTSYNNYVTWLYKYASGIPIHAHPNVVLTFECDVWQGWMSLNS